MRGQRLQQLMEDFSPDEEDIVFEVVQGIRTGRDLYGALTVATDPRNFALEASAEQRDLAVYLAAEVVRRGRRDR